MTLNEPRFETGDLVTDTNLMRLWRLATNGSFDGDFEQVDGWLVAVIRTIKSLPAACQEKVYVGYFQIRGAHVHWTNADRPKEWRRLADELRRQLLLIIEDDDLRAGGKDNPNIAGRGETRGERIGKLCDKLENTVPGMGNWDRIVREIQSLGAGTGIWSDGEELIRHGKRQRRDPAMVTRTIMHIRMIASDITTGE